MAKIEDTKTGRKDGGYSRLFGNDDLGSLFSQVHATSIRAGTELELLITAESTVLKDLDGFINGTLKQGTYLITKKLIKSSETLKYSKEPDFLILVVKCNRCLIIELKDGDGFDTKKSAGELKHLLEYQTHLSKKVPYKTAIYVCCFNQEDKQVIFNGFKGKFTLEQIMTGSEFCKLLDIKKDDILQTRKKHQQENIAYLKNRLKSIHFF